MPRYACELIDARGRRRRVAKEAASESKAAEPYSRGELFLVSIRELRGEAPKARASYKSEEVREFTIMLSSLLDSGLSLREALTIAAEIAPRGRSGRSLPERLLESIGKGDSLSEALGACGESFSEFYRGMVRIGERVGSAEKVFPRLAAYLTEAKALRDKASAALAYPAMVCALALLGSAGIVLFLLPRLLEAYSGLGGEAAARARESAAAMTAALRAIGFGLAGALALAFVSARLRKVDEGAAAAIDAIALRLPFLGRVLSAFETLNFAFAMETLSGGGVSVEAGIGEAAGVVHNRAYRRALQRCRDELRKGESLSSALTRSRELPRNIARWVAIGERSGRAEGAFEQLRRYYRGEVDRASSRFMALVEPALILAVGSMSAIMIMTFILPLFSMYGAML